METTSKMSQNMKAIILSAGSGTRMKPFSFSESKTMMNFLGKPLLAHHIEEFIKNNIKKFVIVCNSTNANTIRDYFSNNYSQYHFDYIILDQPRGPSHAVYAARSYLKGTFIVKYGDSISEEDQIAKLLSTYEKDQTVDAVVTLREEVDNPQEYGIAKFDDNGKLIQIVEKPKENPPSKYANVGFFLFKAESLFPSIDKIGFQETIPPPEYVLRNKGTVSYWITKGRRIDLGRPWNILEATKFFIDKLGGKTETQNIYTDKISEKSYIGPNTIIEKDVEIGDYCHINSNCLIRRNTKLKNTYIMNNTKIGKNCKINYSVIGKNNIIGNNFRTLTKSQKELGIFTGENVIIKSNLKSYPGRVIFPNKIITKDIKNDFFIRAILFDIDNTLIKTKEAAKIADLTAMQIFASNTNFNPKEIYDKWQNIVKKLQQDNNPEKRTRKYSYKKLANNLKIKTIGTQKPYKIFLKKLAYSIKTNKNVIQTLAYLKKYKLATITEDSRETTIAKLKSSKIYHYFDLIITSDDIKKMKPHKDYYLIALNTLQISPKECLVIGDNYEKDLAIAKDLGCMTVHFNTDKPDKRADYKITNFKDLLKLIKNL